MTSPSQSVPPSAARRGSTTQSGWGRNEHHRPYSLITFGGGPRVCIGINFAQIEVKALVAHVLDHYSLEAVDQEVVRGDHWTAIVPNGIRLRVRGR